MPPVAPAQVTEIDHSVDGAGMTGFSGDAKITLSQKLLQQWQTDMAKQEHIEKDSNNGGDQTR